MTFEYLHLLFLPLLLGLLVFLESGDWRLEWLPSAFMVAESPCGEELATLVVKLGNLVVHLYRFRRCFDGSLLVEEGITEP